MDLKVSKEVAANIVRAEMAKVLGYSPQQWEKDGHTRMGSPASGVWEGVFVEIRDTGWTDNSELRVLNTHNNQHPNTEVAINAAIAKLRDLGATK